MYEQSFKYLSRLLMRWLQGQAPVAGDRFYVQFEDADAVANLCAAFEDLASARLDCGGGFFAPVISGSPAPIVIAGSQMGEKTIQGAFLTKLRNNAAAQVNGFKDKCLLIIDHTGLDSIVHGGGKPGQRGAPTACGITTEGPGA